MIGRRVASIAEIERAGDYCGPIRGYTGDVEACFFRLPLEGDDLPPGSRSLHHVAFPPHTYRECDDGSLEIRASIGAHGSGTEYVWHGYLDEGHVWRSVSCAPSL